MSRKQSSPIIVIKRPKKGGGGHHGGAWKIAYADFVTAMMAFFLLLWLLGATTEEQRKGISDYFNVVTNSGGGSNGVLQGKVIDIAGGQRTAATPSGMTPIVLMPAPGLGRPLPQPTDDGASREEAAFAEIERNLEAAVKDSPELAGNMLVERTPDGLRIQLIDQERSPMFASGSAVIVPRMEQLLKLVAAMVARVPNTIAIGGHTDAHPLQRGDYSNWELSAERANAARRLLVANGVPESRIVRVLGLADRQPLIKDDPMAASNRRISILLMSMRAAKDAAS
ncbi:flagellar motor protein MotB [Benzoatithermus flavus]|uniref:Flagellar motor protein MotB n=1 Tax=Benzoatithermus flavus TaxID=3108223 RepID=A0ABU8XUT7_9PROT